jgi:hypothetical protein
MLPAMLAMPIVAVYLQKNLKPNFRRVLEFNF